MNTATRTVTGWKRFRADVQDALLAGVDDHVHRLGWDAERLAVTQRDGLRRLLTHAVEHSPFHRRRLAGVDVDRVDPSDLTGLPVMTKADMMGSFDDVVTDRRLTLRLIERALNTLQAPALYGYASMLTRLAVEQRAGRLQLSPLVVTSTSETLTADMRSTISEAFGAPVIDTFVQGRESRVG